MDVKENQKESTRKKVLAFIGIVVIIGAFLYFLVNFVTGKIFTKNSGLVEISLDRYIDFNDSEDRKIIYISSSANESIKEYESSLVDVMDDRKSEIYYLDLTKVNKDGKILAFMEANELTENSFVEPMIIIIEDKEVKEFLLGVVSKADIVNFLDKNNID